MRAEVVGVVRGARAAAAVRVYVQTAGHSLYVGVCCGRREARWRWLASKRRCLKGNIFVCCARAGLGVGVVERSARQRTHPSFLTAA